MASNVDMTIVSPDDQNVTFVELFFDLVFVFSVTQIVGLMHGHIGWETVGQSVLVFWLVWWAWTQFTWALNAANTNHAAVRIGTLLATAIAFFMAVTLPDVFQGKAMWFALPYVLVRITGLTIYARVATSDPEQIRAVKFFTLVSVSGMISVLIGGYLEGTLIYWFWGGAILLDIIAATIGGQSDGWNLHPDHFGERHGLFVIIALGETLIVAGSSVAGTEWNILEIIGALMAVAVTSVLWWSYFARIKPNLDRSLEHQKGAALSMMARDVFSLFHFPMLCGVIAIAVVFEEVVGHPDTPLGMVERLTLATGVCLFVVGMAFAYKRATGHWLVMRISLTAVTAIALILISEVSPLISLGVAFTGIAVICNYEQSAVEDIGSSTISCAS